MSTPLPTPSIPDSHHNAPHPSRASIALIAASLVSFVLFVYLSVHRRPSRDALATPSPAMTNKPSAKRKPMLWEVCLDEDDHRELTRLDGAVRNWQPITAWTDNRLGRSPRSRQASAPRALPDPVMEHHVAMAQAWLHGTHPLDPRRPTHFPTPHLPASPSIPDSRTLNVAVIVAMPSRRPPPQPMHGTTPHHPIGSRLSYSEGQLSIGTTSLSCISGHALTSALPEHELEQTT
ncbi:hypothetical protein BJY52DRAFT_1246605 [Lactarius psammicola]|nr:hypothetical protein BJY52DRAFT_1246605 [Lactarius psammicola]